MTTRSTDRRKQSERGAILILTALSMILLLMIAAFATDLGAWYRQGQEQQRAADVASLNGIQAYDAALKAYVEGKGAATFSDLTSEQQEEAETEAMQAAMDAITGALAAGGVSITNSPNMVTAAPPAGSTASVTAVNGSTILVTRNAANEVVVNITQEGTQYFSNFVRDAPDIVRSGTAVISNCNADCSREIELEPPFEGFAAGGSGDGFRPMIGDDDTIWTVNHHNNQSQSASVVCMDINAEATCSHAPLLTLNYGTHNKADDVIDNNRNQIYFVGHDFSTNTVGIVCVSTDAPGYCSGSSEYTAFTGHSHTYLNNSNATYFPGNITAQGLWRVGTYPNDRLFAMGQDGRIHCLLPDNLGSGSANCSGYPRNSSAAGQSWTPSLAQSQGVRPIMGELIGDQIITWHQAATDNTGYFSCWDTSSNSNCWGSARASGQSIFGFASRVNTPVKFVRYNTSGTPNGFCIAPRTAFTGTATLPHECVSLTGTIQADVSNLTITHPPVAPSENPGQVYGEGFTWINTDPTKPAAARMFFGGLYSDRLNCYDWLTATSCGSVDAVDLYGISRVNNECLIGVGHTSQFYSFSPTTLDPCTGSTVIAPITPCLCSDDSRRYGVLELPDELIAVLNTASASVWTNQNKTGSPLMTIDDLLAGPVDLSAIDASVHGTVWLEIAVDSKLDDTGNLLWTETYNASLALTVQPTLSN
jgi:hypothetical protein